MKGLILEAAAWSGTYLLHSTVCLGLAWCAARALRPGARRREWLWKGAVLVPFLSATLQWAVPATTVAPRIAVELPQRAETAATFAGADTAKPAAVPATRAPAGPIGSGAGATTFTESAEAELANALGAQGGTRGRLGVLRTDAPEGLSSAGSSPSPEIDRPIGFGSAPVAEGGAPAALVAAVRALQAFLALALLWGLIQPTVRVARHLRGRERRTSGPLVDALDHVRQAAGWERGVALSVSDRLDSPVAIGWARPEIVVPPRAAELPEPLMRAMLAHELAHHARRDPMWLRGMHALVVLFPLQPLNRVARREIAGVAELLADDQAVAWTRDRFSLARCLTEVAGWVRGGDDVVVPVAAMVHRTGATGLAARVERALDAPSERSPKLMGPVLAVAAAATTVAVPGFALGSPSGRTPDSPEAIHPSRLEERGEAALGHVLTELQDATRTLEALPSNSDPRIAERGAELRARIHQLTQQTLSLSERLAARRAR